MKILFYKIIIFINLSSNIYLIKIIQKVRGTNDTLSPTFQKVGGHVPPPPQQRPCTFALYKRHSDCLVKGGGNGPSIESTI